MKNQTIIVNKIKDSYCEKQVTKLDELKSLDKKVKRPAKIFAYIFGVAGTLILGAGDVFCNESNRRHYGAWNSCRIGRDTYYGDKLSNI